MISPTGLGIRVDTEGDGNYGARRGSRLHNGVDYICKKGQNIIAPFDMTIKRMSYPNKDMVLNGIVWVKGKSNGRLFYFYPNTDLIGTEVKEGYVIGVAQSISEYYELPLMLDHVHFQVNK